MKIQETRMTTKRSVTQAVLALLLATGAGLGIVGCATGGNSNVADNPGVAGGPSSAQYNTYVGTQSVQWSANGLPSPTTFQYGGVWSLSIDDSTKFFQYQNIDHQGFTYTYSANFTIPTFNPTLGNLTGNGFFSLTPNGTKVTAPGAGGYALEVPGEAAVLRAGNDTVAPVIAVQTSGCIPLSGTSTYQFISLGTPDSLDPTPHVAYGSVQLSNTGVAYTFANLKMYGFDGTDLQAKALPAAGCGETAVGFAISIAPVAVTNNLEVTAQISPNGYFILDQGQGDPTLFNVAPGATGPLGLVGVLQPKSQLTTSTVVAGKYLGFEVDPINNTIGRAGTLPVSFGTVAGAGTVMTGGTYANDDTTQTPSTDIAIDLGPQDAQNGLYKSVSVTLPDVNGNCITQTYGGMSASGKPTCTYKGYAVVGNPAGKYAIFVTVNDIGQANGETNSGTHYSKYGALNFYLYQQ